MEKTYEKVCTNRLFLLGISGEVLLDLPDPFTCSTMQVSDAQAEYPNYPLCQLSDVSVLAWVAARPRQTRSREERN